MAAADVAEHHDAQDAQVVRLDLKHVDMRTPLFALIERMRASNICPRCSKTRVLLDLSAPHIRVKTERPDPAVHCACPGGPAYTGTMYAEGTTVVARHQLIYFEGRDNSMRYIAAGTHGVIAELRGPIAAVVFDGHPKAYLHNTARLDAIVELAPTNDGGSL